MIIKNVSNLVKNKQAIMEKFNFTGFCSKLQLSVLTFYLSLAPWESVSIYLHSF